MAGATRDKAGRPVIAVTGMGVVTSLGIGKADNWAKLSAGVSGIRRISRFPLDSLRTTIAGSADDVYKDYMPPAELSERMALLAGEEAIAESGIGTKGHFPGPLFLALPPLEIEWPYRRALAEHARGNGDIGYPDLLRVAREPQFSPIYETLKYGIIGEHLAAHFGTEGSPISLTTACASGATSVQLGVEAIRRGECVAALALGADGSLTAESLVRFSLLSALSTQNDPPEQASKPFSKDRDGFVLAEGAGALVLEDFDHARARGARVLGILEGCGEKSDSFHRTRSSPDGKPIIACMRNALADAGVGPEEVDYINAHGTSTPENDKMEHLGVSTVFGDRIRGIPISSNKSMIGHTLTAAGAIEAVFTLLTLEHGRIPPTINHNVPDPAIPLDVVPNVARDARIDRAISNSFGFGGQNVCLVMTREPA
ncbi:MAG TPA: beta-ketoacyl-ACP synthase [Xanthobacteraceae bacterium]|nr:beta-ketoacyl-ACP synthase [Xanthobacteraceae bacterium]